MYGTYAASFMSINKRLKTQSTTNNQYNTMNNTIYLKITIENEISVGVRGTFEVSDMIFTEYDRVLMYETISKDFKKALKCLGGYKTMTMTLSTYDRNQNYYGRNENDISHRFVNEYGTLKHSPILAGCYRDFQPCDKGEVDKTLRALIEIGNSKFISLIKEQK
jgi:hypothetical protein